MHNTATAEISALGCTAEGCAIGAFAAEDGGLVVVPVVLFEVEAAVLGPEEEPDAGYDEAGADEADEGEDGFVRDFVGLGDAGAGIGEAFGGTLEDGVGEGVEVCRERGGRGGWRGRWCASQE